MRESKSEKKDKTKKGPQGGGSGFNSRCHSVTVIHCLEMLLRLPSGSPTTTTVLTVCTWSHLHDMMTGNWPDSRAVIQPVQQEKRTVQSVNGLEVYSDWSFPSLYPDYLVSEIGHMQVGPD